ncbi:hypothetical protein CH289_18890 [Rhodococcus sp. RS1C4]|nr:AAA family ATPase [Rhodococcus sp. RS1C4]OZC48460.1 hypothetical protein CH289_18890 [Rhodococcus sp. RS1C4]
MYNLDFDGNFLVTGPPGTGKSVMALYRAQILSFDERGPSVLMYNNMLQQYTEQAATEMGIASYVTTFHAWLGKFWWSTYKETVPSLQPYVPDWPAIWQRFAAEPVDETVLQDVLVDEGQDLSLDFFRLSHFLAKNVTVFADENQQLSDQNTTIDEIARAIKPKERLELRRNYRNTVEIAKVAAAYYAGSPTGIPDLPTRHGERPTLRQHENHEALADFITRYAKARSNLTIGIACFTRRFQLFLLRILETRKLPVQVQTYIAGDNRYNSVGFDTPGITLLNMQSLKGLEFDTLFVPELQQVTRDPSSAATRMLFYVVMSRARDELHLSYSGGGEIPAILDCVKGLVREL